MWRLASIPAATCCLWFAPATKAIEPATGNWKLTYILSPTVEVVDCIFNLEKKDGQWTLAMVAGNARLGNVDAEFVSLKDGFVTIKIKRGNSENTFEGVIDKNEKKILGSFGDDRRVSAAEITWTEDEQITGNAATRQRSLAPTVDSISKIESEFAKLAAKRQQVEDDEERKSLDDEIAAKQKVIESEVPKLLKQTLVDHADHQNSLDAALRLLRDAKKNHASPEEIKQWLETAVNFANRHGPRYRTETKIVLSESLALNPAGKSAVVNLVREVESELGTGITPSKLERVLTTLVLATGDSPEGKTTVDRLEAVSSKLDAEYLAKLPQIEVKPYEGRKEDSGQLVLMELFTGAQCPPCVAADIAFEKLIGAYKPTELVLLQYHLHVPGPDPMTNNDTEARWKYYRDAFPDDVRGVPSVIFNGKTEVYLLDDPKKAGGGGAAAAGGKLNHYREIIDPILDSQQTAKIALKATRTGDTVTIATSVSDIDEPSDTTKLRFALVEEKVRYLGGNGIRLHHHVVRSLPGGAAGIALAGKNDSKQVLVNITELRGQLTKHLDDFVAKRGPFPKPNRPMELKRLKVIAWVQEDKDHTVIQAAQADVKETQG